MLTFKTMNKNIGEEIKELRIKAGYTLRAFAKEVDASAAHISDIEHNRRLPSDVLLERIVVVLARVGASMEQFRKLDTRLDPLTKKWVEDNPEARQILRVSKDSGKSVNEILEMLQKSLNEPKKKRESGEDPKRQK